MNQATKGESQTGKPRGLPHLPHNTVPRRYEETKPVLIQGNAHSKILGLGHMLISREFVKAEQEKQQAIRSAEEAVWRQAEEQKAEALEKCRQEAALDQEKAIKKLKKAHAKALKEEALKVEMAMQKLAIEQVKQERAEGEERLKKIVLATEARCHNELLAAVAKAREEERQIAATEAAKVAKYNQEQFDAAMKKTSEEMAKALKELRDAKDLEKASAVQSAETRERKIAKEQCRSITGQFEAVVEKLRSEIEAKNAEISKLEEVIAETSKSKDNVETCLVDTRKDFQDFIDNLPPFDKSQADFLLPIVYIDELEKKGYNAKSLKSALPRRKTKK